MFLPKREQVKDSHQPIKLTLIMEETLSGEI